MDLVIGIILIVAAVFLVAAILMQEGKSNRLSGAIAGGADTFFGKKKGKKISEKLSKITTVVAICFTVVVLLLYVFQENGNKIKYDALDNVGDSDTRVTTTTDSDTDTGDVTDSAAVTDSGNVG